MGRVKTRKYRLLYSETSKNLIRKLHPQLKPIIKSKIEKIKEDPHLGKSLENELAGYLSLRVKRYRIIYQIDDINKIIQVHYVGHRKDVYELLGEQIRKKR